MRPLTTGYLGPLTGLRFLAALHVIFFHFRDIALAKAPADIYEIANKGYVSVGLFFVLSGFILAHSYVGPQGDMRTDNRSFWVARFARIYPVYFLSLIITAPSVWAVLSGADGTGRSPDSILAAVLLISLGQGWTLLPAMAFGWPTWSFAMSTLDWNFPVWSLGVESFFYLVFPFMAPPLARLRTAHLALVLALVWGLSVAPPLLYSLVPGAAYPSDHGLPAWNWVINYSPVFRLPEFLFGIVLGHLYGRYALAPWIGSRLVRVAGVILPVVAIAALIRCFVTWIHSPGLLIANGLLDPLFGAIVCGLAVSDQGLAWLLTRRPLLLLGEASYALYLLHIPIWMVVSEHAWRLFGPTFDPNTPWFFVVYLVGVLGVVIGVFQLWERPARSYLRRLLSPSGNETRARAPVSPHDQAGSRDASDASRSEPVLGSIS